MISSFGFTYMVSHDDPSPGVQKLLGIFAAIMFLGLITTFLIPETKGRSLEEINDEYPSYLLLSPSSPTPRLSPSLSLPIHLKIFYFSKRG